MRNEGNNVCKAPISLVFGRNPIGCLFLPVVAAVEEAEQDKAFLHYSVDFSSQSSDCCPI